MVNITGNSRHYDTEWMYSVVCEKNVCNRECWESAEGCNPMGLIPSNYPPRGCITPCKFVTPGIAQHNSLTVSIN